MPNLFTPFPRYENAIVVGDSAAEALAALRIYARALVGGDIPSVEMWHPTEKLLECIHCALRNRPKILDAAAKRIQADYILLEQNGVEGLDPCVLQESLQKNGFQTKVLDVRGNATDVILRAGELFGEQKQAQRVVRDYEERMQKMSSVTPLQSVKVLTLLGVRHPVEDVVYCFAVTQRAEISKEVIETLGCVNPVDVPQSCEDIQGMYGLTQESLAELLVATKPDVIALSGDSTAAMQFVSSAVSLHPEMTSSIKAFQQNALFPLPWYCRPMGWRRPRVLEIWYRALRSLQKRQ